MKSIISILFSLLFITVGYSQGQTNKTVKQIIIEKVTPGVSNSITMHTYNTDTVDIINLSNDLGISEGIIDVTYDFIRKTFSFSYNENLNQENLYVLFKENNMANLLDQKI